MRRFPITVAGVTLLALGVGACEPAAEDNMPEADVAPAESVDPGLEVATEYAPELNVDLTAMERRESGLLVQELAPGEGTEAMPGDMVAVHYTGWLPDGTKFDSSLDRGEPIVFALGQGQVIDGWDEGVAGMRPGGRRKLVIPSALGYGPAGNGPIPGGATMVFDVELVRIGS